jgi:HEAT repeat protein
VEILIRVVSDDRDPRVRLKAAEALRQSTDGRAVEALVAVLAEASATY